MEQMLRALAAQNEVLISRITALEKSFGAGALGRLPPNVDPAPDDFFGGRWPWSPFPWPQRPWPFPGFPGRIPGWPGEVEDPSPEDLGKLSKVQLESRLLDIAHQRLKLDQIEQVVKEAIGAR